MTLQLRPQERCKIDKIDFDSLEPKVSVTDVIIDFYLSYITTKIVTDEQLQGKIHIFATWFYQNLMNKNLNTMLYSRRGVNYANVKECTMDIDLFSKDYVFVPIWKRYLCDHCPVALAMMAKHNVILCVYRSHWILAIICNLPMVNESIPLKEQHRPEQTNDLLSIDQLRERSASQPGAETNKRFTEIGSRARRPIILLFSSRRGSRSSAEEIALNLRQYLCHEYDSKGRSRTGRNEQSNACMREILSELPFSSVNAPMQDIDNSYDCGIYLLLFAERFFTLHIESFDESYLAKLNLWWFSKEDVKNKRPAIQEVIVAEIVVVEHTHFTAQQSPVDRSQNQQQRAPASTHLSSSMVSISKQIICATIPKQLIKMINIDVAVLFIISFISYFKINLLEKIRL